MAIQIDKVFADSLGTDKIDILKAFIILESTGFLARLIQDVGKDVLAHAMSVRLSESENLELKYAAIEFGMVNHIVESIKNILDNNTERKRES